MKVSKRGYVHQKRRGIPADRNKRGAYEKFKKLSSVFRFTSGGASLLWRRKTEKDLEDSTR